MEYRTPMPPGVSRPPPLWALSAEHNAAHIAEQRERRRPAELEIVTAHPPPWRQVGIEELPSAAAGFARAAERAGLEAAGRMAGAKAAQVGIRHRDRNSLWMRATWTRTAAGAWVSRKVLTPDAVIGTVEARRLWH